MKRLIYSALSITMALFLCASQCEKPGPVVPPPPPDSGNTEEGGGNEGGGSEQGGNTDPDPSGTLCTDIGQTPIVLTYFTEYNEENVLKQVHNIYNTVYNILEESKSTGEPEGVIAQRFAEERIRNGLK